MEQEQQTGKPNQSPTRMLTMMATLVTALVGLNTLVVSCSSEKLAKASKLQQEEEEGERFWREIWKDYIEAIRMPSGSLERKSFLAHIALRSNERSDKEERFKNYKQIFNAQFRRNNTKEEREYIKVVIDNLETDKNAEQKIKSENINVKTIADISNVQTNNTISLTPISSDGWDIDVFWCEDNNFQNKNGEDNYKKAKDIGTFFKTLVDGNKYLGGERLGRIRIRKLPASLQSDPNYIDNVGNLLIRYNDDAEKKMAEALVKSKPGGFIFEVAPSQTPTPWYLSLFVCPKTKAVSLTPLAKTLSLPSAAS